MEYRESYEIRLNIHQAVVDQSIYTLPDPLLLEFLRIQQTYHIYQYINRIPIV